MSHNETTHDSAHDAVDDEIVEVSEDMGPDEEQGMEPGRNGDGDAGTQSPEPTQTSTMGEPMVTSVADGADIESTDDGSEDAPSDSDDGFTSVPSDGETLDSLVDTLFEESLQENDRKPSDDGNGHAPSAGDEDPWDDDECDVLVTMSEETTVISDLSPDRHRLRPYDGESRHHSSQAPEESRYKVSVGRMVACLLIGLAIGVLVTFIVTSEVVKGSEATDEDGKTLVSGTVGSNDLDTEMVRYSYGEDEVSLSVRDVITLTGSLDSMRDEATGRYSVPSAEKALEAVRNDIVRRDADRRGIKVKDGDVLDYVSDTYGVATIGELAKQVGLDDAETERQLRDRLVIKFLKENVIGDKKLLPLVEPPSPDSGDPEVLTEGYAAYIINIAGDEWDAIGKKWKSDSGAFASALAETPFDGGLASYDMAMAAYDVVRQRNEEIQRTIDGAWSDYINGMFRQAKVTLSVASR